MLLVYSSFAVFFVFEGSFELIKARIVPYIISAIFSATLAFGFPFGVSVATIFGLYNSKLSYTELLMCSAIGLYCTAKVVAYVLTVHRVIILSDTSSHSGKFDKKFENPTEQQDAATEPSADSKNN